MRVLLVEDEPYLAEAIRDSPSLEAIAADVAGDGDAAPELLSVNADDIAVLNRDIPGPSGDEIANPCVAPPPTTFRHCASNSPIVSASSGPTASKTPA